MTRAGGVTIAERRQKYRQPTSEDQQPKVALPPVPAAAIPNLTLEPAGDESEEENEEDEKGVDDEEALVVEDEEEEEEVEVLEEG